MAFIENDEGEGELAPFVTPRALQLEEMPYLVRQYERAARNAIKAGLDGVEVHGANGYLLDQFLCSGTNQRTDAYGGPVENRTRLLLEVVDVVCVALLAAAVVGGPVVRIQGPTPAWRRARRGAQGLRGRELALKLGPRVRASARARDQSAPLRPLTQAVVNSSTPERSGPWRFLPRNGETFPMTPGAECWIFSASSERNACPRAAWTCFSASFSSIKNG
jgi:hypothetical protein